LIISHQERILNIADKIVVVAGGKVKQYGPKDDILPELLGRGAAESSCKAFN
jgi:Fe-S cluster assembly ATP-binding protein